MKKDIVSLQVKKNERLYQLLIESGSSLGELYDVIVQMKNYVHDLMKENEPQVPKKEYIPTELVN